MTEPVFIDVPLSELVARARNTLRAERAKPRDIALAWARLCAFEQGEDFGGNEKSYRRIYDAHQWILAQGFALSDSAGMPAGPIKGVTVKPPGYDVEDRMMVRVADVRAKAKEQGRPWPKGKTGAADSRSSQWIEQARDIALSVIARINRNGKQVKQDDVCAEVAQKLAAEGFTKKNGNQLDGETVRRDAISPGEWWQKHKGFTD